MERKRESTGLWWHLYPGWASGNACYRLTISDSHLPSCPCGYLTEQCKVTECVAFPPPPWCRRRSVQGKIRKDLCSTSWKRLSLPLSAHQEKNYAAGHFCLRGKIPAVEVTLGDMQNQKFWKETKEEASFNSPTLDIFGCMSHFPPFTIYDTVRWVLWCYALFFFSPASSSLIWSFSSPFVFQLFISLASYASCHGDEKWSHASWGWRKGQRSADHDSPPYYLKAMVPDLIFLFLGNKLLQTLVG